MCSMTWDDRAVSGGMSRRAGPSLAERVAATRAAAEERARDSARPSPGLGKHCWVLAAPCSAEERTAAVLVEWRQDSAGQWEGRVVYALQLSDRVSVLDTWIPSSLLEPWPR